MEWFWLFSGCYLLTGVIVALAALVLMLDPREEAVSWGAAGYALGVGLLWPMAMLYAVWIWFWWVLLWKD